MSDIVIIPEPVKLKRLQGSFKINPQTVIFADEKLKSSAQAFVQLISPATGLNLPIKNYSSDSKQDNTIIFKKAGQSCGESYNLQVSHQNITICAGAEAGAFYAVQTLRQLLPAEIESSTKQQADWNIPAVEIEDCPRYQYRGMHLDVCRHYFSVDFIKKYIDLLAMHKFNYFHWHLTEDQGWRIEIKRYPQLSEVSAWRNEDGKKYGKIYTQDEIKEIVRYADVRHITVIPEIEMPGHSVAALAAFPNLSCTGRKFEVGTKWGVYEDVYCAGNDEVFEFLGNVIEEVISLFPGRYFHIGGDECKKIRWEQCPKCQERINKENLKDENELQHWFIEQFADLLKSNNKKLVGWDEILEGGTMKDVTVMSWRGTDGGVKAAKAGNPVIMTPCRYCYFDYKYRYLPNGPGIEVDQDKSQRTYSLNPDVPAELTASQAKNVIGVQGCLWTEHIKTAGEAELMSFPRMCELSEVAWTPQNQRNFKSYKQRIKIHLRRLDILGVSYYCEPEILD
ncbi:MAG: beta-N-acetylhexosaminidase [Anaerohalosphaeraceae bacterium]|nr:beta-N-acetylhexosaminidase [Anaerohalosphaeraceae bacterium]